MIFPRVRRTELIEKILVRLKKGKKKRKNEHFYLKLLNSFVVLFSPHDDSP